MLRSADEFEEAVRKHSCRKEGQDSAEFLSTPIFELAAEGFSRSD